MAVARFAYQPLLAGGIIAGAVLVAAAFRPLRLRHRSPARLAAA